MLCLDYVAISQFIYFKIRAMRAFMIRFSFWSIKHQLPLSTSPQEASHSRGGGGGTSLWVRRGCAPVLGSFWPENSGIGVSFYWKISVIGAYFHSEFSGIGGYSKFCNGC